jgi:SAM-dependent methyltransferase
MGKLARHLRRLVSPALQRPDVVDRKQAEAGIDLLYRFLLARPADEEGRRHYLRLMRDEGMKLREVASEIASSDEFQRRLKDSLDGSSAAMSGRAAAAVEADLPPSPKASADHRSRGGGGQVRRVVVDPRDLATTLSVEQLAGTADDYYRNTLEFADRYLAKPFDDPHEAPVLVGSFAQLLAGVRLARGMTVLDFGAGVCWTTRCLTQLGCRAIALDVSATALDLGKQLYARLPPVGDFPAPRFLVFDGRRIDLADESVDRIICFDAFHHVPNPAEVMRELGRVLRPGGIAGFSEPGPHHSSASRSQYEMKNYVAFENDVVMTDMWRWAQAAGFAHLELAVFTTDSHRVPLHEFEDLRSGGRAMAAYTGKVRAFLGTHQTFFLTKRGAAPRDSRDREGLKAEITVRLERADVRRGEPIRGRATLQNVGTVIWLPGSTALGGVNLGVHLRAHDGRPIAVDFARIALEDTTGPGELRSVEFAVAPPEPGDYLLEFDLVSEGVSWFEMNGSPTATLLLSIR